MSKPFSAFEYVDLWNIYNELRLFTEDSQNIELYHLPNLFTKNVSLNLNIEHDGGFIEFRNKEINASASINILSDFKICIYNLDGDTSKIIEPFIKKYLAAKGFI